MNVFRENDNAISPIIGVMLMVAVTVLLAGVIGVFAFGLAGAQTARPTVAIVASNNPDTTAADMKIQDKAGDTLKTSEWEISVVLSGNAPVYWVSNSTSGAIVVGTQMSITGTTDGTGAWASNTTVTSSNALISGKKYDVKLVHIPSNTLLLDQVVEVR